MIGKYFLRWLDLDERRPFVLTLRASPPCDRRARAGRASPRPAASSDRGAPGVLDAVLERRLLRALLERVRAARPELAALRQVDQRRRRAGDRVQPRRPVGRSSRGIEPEQPPRVGMLRVVEELPLRALLDDAAGVHDHDLVGDLGDDAEIVRDQDHRRVEVVLQPVDQLDDLRLDRHVERGRGLVGDQDVRVVRERHRDHRALAHPARELVRDSRRRARSGFGIPTARKQLDRPRSRLLLASRPRARGSPRTICAPTR